MKQHCQGLAITTLQDSDRKDEEKEKPLFDTSTSDQEADQEALGIAVTPCKVILCMVTPSRSLSASCVIFWFTAHVLQISHIMTELMNRLAEEKEDASTCSLMRGKQLMLWKSYSGRTKFLPVARCKGSS